MAYENYSPVNSETPFPAYPITTCGSELVDEVRRETSQLTKEQREEFFLKGMRLIYREPRVGEAISA